MSDIVPLTKAQQALVEAGTLGEVVDVRDLAMAAASFYEAQHMAEEANAAKLVQLQAERKAGSMLMVMEKAKGGRPYHHDTADNPSLVPTLADLDIHPKESQRWQLEASVPDEEFHAWVDERLARGYELTAGGLIRLARGSAEQLDDWQTIWRRVWQGLSLIVQRDDAPEEMVELIDEFMLNTNSEWLKEA